MTTKYSCECCDAATCMSQGRIAELEAKLVDGRCCRDAYRNGLRDGVTRFAWWKDGQQFVGITGTTLADALTEIERSVP